MNETTGVGHQFGWSNDVITQRIETVQVRGVIPLFSSGLGHDHHHELDHLLVRAAIGFFVGVGAGDVGPS